MFDCLSSLPRGPISPADSWLDRAVKAEARSNALYAAWQATGHSPYWRAARDAMDEAHALFAIALERCP